MPSFTKGRRCSLAQLLLRPAGPVPPVPIGPISPSLAQLQASPSRSLVPSRSELGDCTDDRRRSVAGGLRAPHAQGAPHLDWPPGTPQPPPRVCPSLSSTGIRISGLPATCMNLATVLDGDASGGPPTPCGSDCLLYNNLSAAEYNNLRGILNDCRQLRSSLDWMYGREAEG
ncbi:uncharacterized protein QC763_0101840 [Podospora pseudopauciseta]|uniref:Uncharacterized protein n=1 Tax=Podospora pseudopauciseta TaxID=2093780 RepID=A0ABR0GZW4_9PEZI|nr:hypothetical protein QC763_0101840 [Podospora pseudopauciseta]